MPRRAAFGWQSGRLPTTPGVRCTDGRVVVGSLRHGRGGLGGARVGVSEWLRLLPVRRDRVICSALSACWPDGELGHLPGSADICRAARVSAGVRGSDACQWVREQVPASGPKGQPSWVQTPHWWAETENIPVSAHHSLSQVPTTGRRIQVSDTREPLLVGCADRVQDVNALVAFHRPPAPLPASR